MWVVLLDDDACVLGQNVRALDSIGKTVVQFQF